MNAPDSIEVKCVICHYQWIVSPIPDEMPHCPKCFGPVLAVSAELFNVRRKADRRKRST